jgi:hypothetical protein
MFTKPSDLFQFIGLSVFGLAAVLGLTYLLGEVHGLIVTVIILFGQSAQAPKPTRTGRVDTSCFRRKELKPTRL